MPPLQLPSYRYLFRPAIIYLIISLVCTQVPLLNSLGYEFSCLIALISSVVSAFLTIRLVTIGGRPGSKSVAVEQMKGAMIANLSLLGIPLIVMLTNALFVKNCSLLQGVGFFIFLPVVSVVFATGLGFFCAIRFRFPRVIFLLIAALTLLYAAAIGYFTPAIFSYNFFFGFFPGVTYDEVLGLSGTLILFRAVTLVLGVFFGWMGLIMVEGKGRSVLASLFAPGRRIATSLAGICFLTLWFFRGSLGFESTAGFIQKELGASIETEHFTIFYSAQSFTDEEIHWIAGEHEFRYNQIMNAFHLPPREQRIESYIYPSVAAKQRYIGAGTTSIAKPWSGQIHLSAESFNDVLKHELVHVLAAPFGASIIDASFYPGLTEGLAMAIEWDWGNRTLHEYSAMMRRGGVEPDVERIMGSVGFVQEAPSVSYVLAGSFCRYLIDTYGIRQMTTVYRSGDYEATYGNSLHDLVTQWHAMLDTITVGPHANDIVDAYFRRPPIFRKTCARVIAGRNMEAKEKFAEKDYRAAAGLYFDSYRDGAGYDALSGYLLSALRAGNSSAVTAGLDTIILRQDFPGRFLPLFLTIGDAFWNDGKLDRAHDLYVRVRFADLSEPSTEAANVRLIALQDSGHRGLFLRYFLSDEPDSARIRIVDSVSNVSPVASYLKAKALLRMKKYDEGASLLESLDFSGVSNQLEATRLKFLGRSLFRLKRFEEARTCFWNSLNALSTPAARNDVDDWVERCEWVEKNPEF